VFEVGSKPRAGTPVFPNLPVQPSGDEHRVARVCIATYEILGPSKSGGIGTAYHSLATALTAANHQVTILYLWAARSDDSEMRYWQRHFRTMGITFVPLPRSSQIAGLPDCIATASEAHAWLRQRQFDVIHFPELHGHGYFCVVAKHQGLDFDRTVLCIGTHSPISWIREQNKEVPYSPEELEMDFMERQCVALADVVVSPSQYMLGWMQSRGWVLPDACYVQQNVTLPDLTTFARRVRREGVVQRAAELVFFGRLEARKGIGLFCDALDLVECADLPGFSITFLGKNGRIEGRDAVSYIRARAQHWAFNYRILTDYDHEAALKFLLADAGRIAVIPSFEDNLPYTVVECLSARIPLLAGAGGGIPELIAMSDLERVTFPPDAVRLAERLTLAIRDGVPIARPAIDANENRQRWVDWHSALSAQSNETQHLNESGRLPSVQPRVTVFLNYRGDCEMLHQSMASLQRQTYPSLEVLVFDYSGGGTEDEVRREMQNFVSKGWRLVPAHPDCTTMRTDTLPQTAGEYSLLMGASDYLTSGAVATFVEVATHTGADVLTCFLALFAGRQEPVEASCLGHYPFLGRAILSGVFRNYFGQRVIFTRTNVLHRLGSFPGNYRRDGADWQFLARAALMDCRMEVIPAPLAWYRVSDESGPHLPLDYLDQVRALTPYAEAMPEVLHDLPKAALTMGLHYQRLHQRLDESRARAILQERAVNLKSHKWDSVVSHEGALLQAINAMPRRSRKRIASMVDGWLEHSRSRAQLPPPGFQRLSQIIRQLLRGRYHRYAHGFGSALRDLRKPARHEP
jgi:O-antigen biosynthesis protein